MSNLPLSQMLCAFFVLLPVLSALNPVDASIIPTLQTISQRYGEIN